MANKLRKRGKLEARSRVFGHLAQVAACPVIQGKRTPSGAARRILDDLRRCPGVGLYQANQLWLLLRFIQKTYPKGADQGTAEAGPGTQRGIL